MARSLLGSFVLGSRQVLMAQLLISVFAVGLAGWTLGVTNDLIRERDRLRERVIQLEEAMAARGEMPPRPPAVVDRPVTPDYPGSIDTTGQPSEESGDQTADAGTDTVAPIDRERDFGRIIGELFAPPPPMRTVVLHVRSQNDQPYAQRLAAELMQAADVRAVVTIMQPRDARSSGYAYYDGRQSRSAAALVQQFNDIARQHEIAPWSAQLRGTALPAQGEYDAARLDIVLPPLPPPQRLDLRMLERQTQQQPPPEPVR
jgi:hypothetical protein